MVDDIKSILPFASGADYWPDAATGDYAADCRTGRERALAVVDAIQGGVGTSLLGHVVRAIGVTGAWSGVEVGFFQVFAERA